MSENILDPRMVHMPDFVPGDWLNTNHPLTKANLRGRVLLIDFWDYTCINCIRTLPYLTAWADRYESLGLTVIGIHAPEFKFAHARRQIEAALNDFQIRYPVLLDNQYENWQRFANRAWPTKYLIDAEGYIRHKAQGEGYYQQTEHAIQAALRERDPDVVLPEVIPPLRDEDTPGAVCYRATPELLAGYERGSLGNREGYAPGSPLAYRLPLLPERIEPYFYAGGLWRAGQECFIFAGHEAGRIILPYHAASVNAVLSPSGDPVEVMLDLRPDDVPPVIELRQDGEPLHPVNAGADVRFDDQGMSFVHVDRPRLYELVHNPDFESHQLELTFRAHGLALYAFTFTTCVDPTVGVGKT